MKCYKIVRLRKNGTIGSLFIQTKAVLPFKEWLQAGFYPTKGFAPRYGWHCTFQPYAPHLSEKGRAWVECEVEDFDVYNRPESQGGAWILAWKLKINKILTCDEVEVLRQKFCVA